MSRANRLPGNVKKKRSLAKKAGRKQDTVTLCVTLLDNPDIKKISSLEITRLNGIGLGNKGRVTFSKHSNGQKLREKLLEHYPELGGLYEFNFCRLGPDRKLTVLPKDVTTPVHLRKALGRSSLYLQPNTTIHMATCSTAEKIPQGASSFCTPPTTKHGKEKVVNADKDVQMDTCSTCERHPEYTPSFQTPLTTMSGKDKEENANIHVQDPESGYNELAHGYTQRLKMLRRRRRDCVPPEPEKGIVLKIIMTDMNPLLRRFDVEDDFMLLVDFIGSQEEASLDFDMYFPAMKKTLHSSMTGGVSLKSLGITASMVVYVKWEKDDVCYCNDCNSKDTESTSRRMEIRSFISAGTPTVSFSIPVGDQQQGNEVPASPAPSEDSGGSELMAVSLIPDENNTKAGSDQEDDHSPEEIVVTVDVDDDQEYQSIHSLVPEQSLTDSCGADVDVVHTSHKTRDISHMERERNSWESLPFVAADFVPLEFMADPELALEMAIQDSLKDATYNEEAKVNVNNELDEHEVKMLVQHHSERVLTQDIRSINVSRTNLWKTFMPYMRRAAFLKKMGELSVTFVNDEGEEDASDLGGPRREFFRLLKNAICNDSGVLEASPSGMLFKPNITAYKNGLYKMIGQMFAMCLVQGGEPPSILAPPVVDYLVSGDITKVNASILDVPNHKVRQDLQKVL
ncbi:G2/M phase-specific E3 ubiquitin-protein ligase [Holothuria leucospilota]|uniref:G2/M phase-specific E3 ubiquitin-protein ligase n=1 Tax=Holothuria leucospilota TaxID=206669 RepID=A0A9Q1BB12_HOLLE|nr:G2/M phase-specific E3 ubiquitin-protein ligase [Holothuria leucospilota]